jgi:hypothetical protein
MATNDKAPLARCGVHNRSRSFANKPIDAEGNVTKAKVADVAHRASPVLENAAINNIQRWTFEKPATAPATQVIVYEYIVDDTLPTSRNNCQVTKVTIDLPNHVTILTNVRTIE